MTLNCKGEKSKNVDMHCKGKGNFSENCKGKAT